MWRCPGCPKHGRRQKKRGRMAANVVCKGVSKGFSAALGPRDVTPVVRSKDLSNDFFRGSFAEDFHAFSARKTLHLLMIPTILQPELIIFSENDHKKHIVILAVRKFQWHLDMLAWNKAIQQSTAHQHEQLVWCPKPVKTMCSQQIYTNMTYHYEIQPIQGPS